MLIHPDIDGVIIDIIKEQLIPNNLKLASKTFNDVDRYFDTRSLIISNNIEYLKFTSDEAIVMAELGKIDLLKNVTLFDTQLVIITAIKYDQLECVKFIEPALIKPLNIADIAARYGSPMCFASYRNNRIYYPSLLKYGHLVCIKLHYNELFLQDVEDLLEYGHDDCVIYYFHSNQIRITNEDLLSTSLLYGRVKVVKYLVEHNVYLVLDNIRDAANYECLKYICEQLGPIDWSQVYEDAYITAIENYDIQMFKYIAQCTNLWNENLDIKVLVHNFSLL